ncbi:MAG TPA: hypothetical protein VF166_02245 [Gemmatimonadaceae bacterium]
MPLWDKLKQELDHAGEIAQGAFDEGRLRLDALRARQRADKAARELGYAVYRARQRGEELQPEEYARLSSALAACEAETARIEERLSQMLQTRRGGRATPPGSPGDGNPGAGTPADTTHGNGNPV